MAGAIIKPDTVISERYKIVRIIGEGGMGNVYEATHVRIGKKVAIKVLAKNYTEDREAMERFQQEAQIAGSIGHINICEVMDFGTTEDGLPYLVMEYLEGESLADLLKEHEFFPLHVALGITVQILDALEEVHHRGIVHRDLKPENVFITNVKGHGKVVKLLDFGISKVMQVHAESLRLTKTGTMLGTPYYMSPEQVRGKKDIDFSTDIYSCGVILYEMITGRTPYSGANYNDVILSIVEDPFPDPRKIIPGLRSEIVRLLKRSMEKDPLKRFDSAASFKVEIAALPLEVAPSKTLEISGTKMSSMTDIQSVVQIKQSPLKAAALVAAAVAIVASLAVLLFYLPSGGGRTHALAGTQVQKKIQAPFLKKVEKKSSSLAAAVVREPERVKVSLMKAPKKVRMTVGDRTVEGTAMELEKSQVPVMLTISAAGYWDKKVEIVPSTDLMIDGKLFLKKYGQGSGTSQGPKKKTMNPIWKY
jgi:serine/threonine protein kinase